MLAQSFLPYVKQKIDREDIEAVVEALQADWITRGPLVEKFEQEVASYCDVKFAVAFNSGSSALEACFHAGDVGPDDRVYSTPNTFVASLGPAVRKGAKPILVDIDQRTGNMDLEELGPLLHQYHSRGKPVIVPVHFAGNPVPMTQLERLVRNPEALIIEDAAQALGARYQEGRPVGCCEKSQMTVFSFHPAKSVTTGEGGMVTTNDPELFRRLQKFRNNGMERDADFLQNPSPGPWYYEVQDLTGNYHMTDFQAALGSSQLKKLDAFTQKRRDLVAMYREAFQGLEGLELSPASGDAASAHHLLVLQIDFEKFQKSRAAVMTELKEKGIGTQVHYIPLYRHPALASFYREGPASFPKMERYYEGALSFPLFVDMEKDDVARVAEGLRDVLGIAHD